MLISGQCRYLTFKPSSIDTNDMPILSCVSIQDAQSQWKEDVAAVPIVFDKQIAVDCVHR